MITGYKQCVSVMTTFFYMVFTGEQRPRLEWNLDASEGRISVEMTHEPDWVHVNYVHTANETRRDFRLM